MPIDGAEVRRIARLARLELEEGDAGPLARELESILRHVAMLDGLDVSTFPPTTSGGTAAAVLREDLPRPSLSPADAVASAPDSGSGFFRVPRVIEE
jgi:aspartyl-tRNA(Asn)/glutamyl-tRNA(Gln) amidotransferase subunit C